MAMAIYGKALREQHEDERRENEKCPCCPHKAVDHKEEMEPRLTFEEANKILSESLGFHAGREETLIYMLEHDNDRRALKPNVFKCQHAGCVCEIKVIGFGKTRKLVKA